MGTEFICYLTFYNAQSHVVYMSKLYHPIDRTAFFLSESMQNEVYSYSMVI